MKLDMRRRERKREISVESSIWREERKERKEDARSSKMRKRESKESKVE